MNQVVSEPDGHAGIRKWIEEHRGITTAVVLIVVLAAILYAIRHARPHDEATFDFIDEETGKPSAHSISEIPPLIGPGGNPSVVRAIYAGSQGSSNRKLLYLEKYSDEAKAYMEEYHRSGAHGPPNVPHPDEAVWVRLPDPGSKWVPRDSEQGKAITLHATR
ncbi:MAG TPA: hypothetical protein VLJ39_10780 [Tepidisphaeraceae bacterium]|nr:hypothetical protein [Tepidisphaeraceae bacterium]